RQYQFVVDALKSSDGSSRAGFARVGNSFGLAAAEPVCAATAGCQATGVAISAVDGPDVTRTVAASGGVPAPGSGMAIFDAGGRLIGSAGAIVPAPPAGDAGQGLLRATHQSAAGTVQDLYAPFSLQGRPA